MKQLNGTVVSVHSGDNKDLSKQALESIDVDFEGITGQMTFTEEGDPIKCAVVVRISDAGEFEFFKSVCP